MSTNQFDRAQERGEAESTAYQQGRRDADLSLRDEGEAAGRKAGEASGREAARQEFRDKPLHKRIGEAFRPR